MRNKKEYICLLVIVSMIVLLFIPASAEVDDEHLFWVNHVTECMKENSHLTFTEYDASLNYLGMEYIRISFEDHDILMYGKKNGIVTCDVWKELSDDSLMQCMKAFLEKWGTDGNNKAFMDDVAVLIVFTNDYSMAHMNNQWMVYNKQHTFVNDIEDEKILEMSLEYINK